MGETNENDFAFFVTKRWGYETYHMSEEQKNDLNFRSQFKLKMVDDLISEGKIKIE